MRIDVLIITLILMSLTAESEEGWSQFNGSGMSFSYPSSWLLVESNTGAIVGVPGVMSITFTMHKEGCYPLDQHPALLDWLLKAYGGRSLSGVPDGSPITQFYINEMGPYSNIVQLYKNPKQFIFIELQGYSAKNITVTEILTQYDPEDENISNMRLDGAKLQKSLIITLPDIVQTISRDQSTITSGQAILGEIETNSASAWLNKSNVLLFQGEYDEALTAIDKAIELNPNDPSARSNRIYILEALGRTSTFANKAEFWSQVGDNFWRQERDNEAIMAYDKALEIQPFYSKALIHRNEVIDGENAP